jgi:hypothetical protein
MEECGESAFEVMAGCVICVCVCVCVCVRARLSVRVRVRLRAWVIVCVFVCVHMGVGAYGGVCACGGKSQDTSYKPMCSIESDHTVPGEGMALARNTERCWLDPGLV